MVLFTYYIPTTANQEEKGVLSKIVRCTSCAFLLVSRAAVEGRRDVILVSLASSRRREEGVSRAAVEGRRDVPPPFDNKNAQEVHVPPPFDGCSRDYILVQSQVRRL